MIKENSILDFIKDSSELLNESALSKGIEREVLRVTPSLQLAQTPHPKVIGSSLTNKYITTDYSEGLLELITPPMNSTAKLMELLKDIHSFVSKNIDSEKLWYYSMPPKVNDESQIKIADYGSSNSGKLKMLYRKGLEVRYGGLMQIIAGIHYNFSVSEELIESIREYLNIEEQDYKSQIYMNAVRNIQKYGWIVSYFYGASPVVHKSFIKSEQELSTFSQLDEDYVYLPYATSLRMSDLGYQNSGQDDLKILYNDIESYTNSLKAALEIESPEWKSIGIFDSNHNRQQLNNKIIQIENEFYNQVRPKSPVKRCERPLDVLGRDGVEYIELRSIDINPTSSIGLSKDQIHFMDLFLLFCMVTPAHKTDIEMTKKYRQTTALVSKDGRNPNLKLTIDGETELIGDHIQNIFNSLTPLAEHFGEDYYTSLYELRSSIYSPNKTLSAKILNECKTYGAEQYFTSLSQRYGEEFKQHEMTEESLEELNSEAKLSLKNTLELEEADTLSFDDYLSKFLTY